MQNLWLYLTLWGLFVIVCTASPAQQKRSYNFVTGGDGVCDTSRVAIITEELENTQAIALYASEHFTDNNFYQSFFSKNSLAEPNFVSRMEKVYSSVNKMTDPTKNSYTIQISCNQKTDGCKGGWAAHMNSKDRLMNFCDLYFNENVIRTTSTVLSDCTKASDCSTLRDYRNTKGIVILHELTHTNFGMGSPTTRPGMKKNRIPKSKDYAYNVADCLSLANGKFFRGNKYGDAPFPRPSNYEPVCPNTYNAKIDGTCDAAFAEWNADTFGLIAAQLWFSEKCGKKIPLQQSKSPAPPPGTGLPGTGLNEIKMPNTIHATDHQTKIASPTKIISKRFTYFSNATAGVNARSPQQSAPACDLIPFNTQYLAVDKPVTDDEIATSAMPSTKTVPANTTAAGTPLPCVNFADPDNSVSNYCTCNNGVKTPNAPGHTGNPCPWTKAPPIPTTAPKVWTTTPLQYPITTSFPNGETDECESYTTMYVAGFPVRKCASGNPGAIVTIHPSSTLTTSLSGPSVTVQAAKNPVPVGTMSSDELYTAISSAIDALCPTPTPGVNTTCNAGQQIIPNIDHIESGYWESDGEIAVEVLSSTYSDPGIREGMIKAAANSAMASANQTNCYTASALNGWTGKRGLTPPEQEPRTLCNAGNFAGVQYFAPGGANTMWLSPSYSFEVAGGTFDCEMAMDALNSLLDLLGPEFAIADAEINNAIQAGCEAFLDHQ